MTRKEKKNALHCLKVMIGEEVCEECDLYGTTGTDHCEADCVRVAIKALEQEPCEDAISRDMALEKMADYVASGYADSVEDFEEYSRIICQLPSVKQEPKTGHWIFVDKAHEHAHCSECDYGNVDLVGGRPHNYCPNCGARMVEPQESEE